MKHRLGSTISAFWLTTAIVVSMPLAPVASASARCAAAPVLWANSTTSLVRFNVATGALTTITTGLETFGDIAVAPNGTLYGVTDTGDLRVINKSDGTTTVAGTINASAVGGLALFRELAFDKYGRGYFIADGGNLLASFEPSSSGGAITPSTVVSNLRAAGFPTGTSAGDIAFVEGDLYITWATGSGIRLMRLDMTDTGSGYAATGAAGSAIDLGAIKASDAFGLAAGGGRLYVSNGSRIARFDHVPAAAGESPGIVNVKAPGVGKIQGLAAEGPATLNGCLGTPPPLAAEKSATMTAGVESRVRTAGPESDSVTYSVTSGTLPPGLSFTESNGNVWGTPTTPGTYRFDVTAKSSNGTSATAQFTITVHAGSNTVAPTSTTIANATPTTTHRTTPIAAGPRPGRIAVFAVIVLALGALLLAGTRRRREA